MKNSILFIAFLLLHGNLFSQMQASHWIFGKRAHIAFPFGNNDVNIDFEPTPINAFSNIVPTTYEGSASISDVNGNLKLYTNGEDVYNAQHQKLNNSRLLGNYTSSQSSIFIPIPNRYNQYYLFTINAQNFISPNENDNLPEGYNLGFYYYTIDLNKNNGQGRLITPPNNKLLKRTAEKVSAVYHQNGIDIWVITYFEDKFYAYLVTENGIQSPIISQVPNFSSVRGYSANSKGYLKISPIGDKIAIAHQNDIILELIPPNIYGDGLEFYNATNLNQNHPGRLLIYDFDKNTGKVTSEKKFNYNLLYYGIEFSSDGKYLYFRYLEDVFNVLMKVSVNNLSLFSSTYQFDPNENAVMGALNLGINGKIYVANQSSKLSVVQKPNLESEYFLKNNQSINPAAQIGKGLPNFIADYLKEELKIYNSFDGKNACINTPLQFWVNNNEEVENILWDFGDGTYSEEVIPSHTYNSSGIYTVKVTINGNIFEKSIVIHLPIDLPVYEMVECDTNDDNIASYNLDNFRQYLGNRAAYISYHINLNDAENNVNALEDLIIQGNQNSPSIWARVINSGGCISFTEIKFKLNISSILYQSESLCKKYDGEYYITIEDIQSNYTSSIFIFQNHQDAENFQNIMNDRINLSENQDEITLYIRQQNFSACDDIIELKINLKNPPIFTLEDREICFFEGETFYNLPENLNVNTIQWNNLKLEDLNQNTNGNSIRITQSGNYSVTVTNALGCEFTSYFNVTNSAPIQLQTMIDQNSNLVIDYGNLNVDDLEFSIDEGINWNNGTIINLPLGEYKLWIRFKQGSKCIVYTENIFNDKLTNFISPNGDGLNDVWQIKGFEKYDWINVIIYNRQGRKLYENRIYQSNILWNGKVNGQPLSSGSYWYKLITSTNIKFEGNIVINNQN